MDEKLLLALNVASMLDPSSTFSFSTRRIKFEDRYGWQVSLLQDRGDRSGPFIFASGVHDTTNLALDSLLVMLRDVATKRHTELVAAASKAAAKFETDTNAALAALGMIPPDLV